MYYVTSIPKIIQKVYPSYLWNVSSTPQSLYVTFDDGPTPHVTDWVLTQLARYDAKATFFMLGKNVEKHPQLAKKVLMEGHTIGNHTYGHLNARKSPKSTFIADTSLAQEVITTQLGISPSYFRPPYGRLPYALIQTLKEKYTLAMMDSISGDFDLGIDGDTCCRNVLRSARPGSIILFHDSDKAFPRLKIALPQVLAHFHKQGIRFQHLPIVERQ